MDLKLKDRLILVTGSTAGMGKALAKLLLQEGARVVINARSERSIDQAWEELSACGTAYRAAGDLGTAEGADAVIRAVEAIGVPDVLVNNAGIYNAIPFEEMTDADWMHMLNVNLMSVVRLCRHFLPQMLRRNSGRILNVSSEVAYKPLPTFLHYCASKAAVLNLSKGMAELTKGSRVTVNTLIPGSTWTEGTARYQTERAVSKGMTIEEHIEDYFNRFDPTSLTRRFVDPEEVAATAAYYCSELSSATNGAPIRVEGGLIRSI